MRLSRFILSSAVCASMLLAGCAKNGGGDEPKTYTVTVTNGGNGTASADKTTVEEGETVKLTATADPGCEFVKWTIVSGGVTLLPDESSNIATFTMPAGNVSVKAEFVVRGVFINDIMWATCNVDAPGTFAASPKDVGMFYQWNSKLGWSSSDPLVNSNGETVWVESDGEGESWAASNDPCPEGWRVPTNEEHAALCDTEKTINKWDTFNGVVGYKFTDKVSGNSLFFPATGHRQVFTGVLSYAGTYGYYWSATLLPPALSLGCFLFFEDNRTNPQGSYNRSFGLAIRCVAQ